MVGLDGSYGTGVDTSATNAAVNPVVANVFPLTLVVSHRALAATLRPRQARPLETCGAKCDELRLRRRNDLRVTGCRRGDGFGRRPAHLAPSLRVACTAEIQSDT